MPLSYRETPATKTVEITLDGKITRKEFDQLTGQLHEFIETHGTIKLIEIIPSFEMFDPSLLWDGMKFDFKHIKFISHCAVVSDIGWISPLSKAAGAFVSTQLRTFALGELKDARQWIAQPTKTKEVS